MDELKTFISKGQNLDLPKRSRKAILIIAALLISSSVQSQILISLVLGDKLNSGTVEFGLEGGANFPTIKGLDGELKPNFNIGFYFDIKTKNPKWDVYTGVLVKASLGTDGLPVYSLNDPALDSSFINGSVKRKLNYFNCPLMMKYKFDKRFAAQAGIMPSLRYKSYDIFSNNIDGNDLEYKNNISDEFRQIDFGLMAGLVYRLMGGNGMNISVQYYYGLIDITKDSATSQYNRSLYLSVAIPIGAGKAKERMQETK